MYKSGRRPSRGDEGIRGDGRLREEKERTGERERREERWGREGKRVGRGTRSRYIQGGRVGESNVMSTSNSTPGPRSKVERVIEKYGLEGLGDELERRWTGETGERESLRSLADRFNRAVLRAALDEAGSSPLDGEVENTYRLLRGDDVSPGMRTEVRRQLERDGVDREQVESDFVSHQAIHTYLREHRGAELETEEDSRVEKEAQTIRRLQGRISVVTESGLTRLANAGDITVGDFEVLSDVQVYCADCGSQYEAVELIERGGCDCAPDEDADADASADGRESGDA
jgi:hypothetical protein